MSSASVVPTSAGNPFCPRTVVLDSVTPEVPGVATYHLRFRDAGAKVAYRFDPGQFNMLYIPGVGEVAISLSADPSSRTTWAHTIRAVGNVTRSLAALRPGETLGLRGPYGSSWPLAQIEGADVVLVAGGIGLAPLRPAICHLLAHSARYGSLTLLYGGRTPASLLFAQEYHAWAKRGLPVETTVDRWVPGWPGRVGVVNLLLERMRLARTSGTIILTCGPEVMMKYVVRSALDRGITPDRIWCSLERNMQCAVGFCGHCQLGPAFLCKDGPILRADRVMPFLSVEGL